MSSDKELLKFIHTRLTHKHNENSSCDYMKRLEQIINVYPESNNCGFPNPSDTTHEKSESETMSNPIQGVIETKLKPFTVPNFVVEVLPDQHPESIAMGELEPVPLSFNLKSLSGDTLSDMCDQFRMEVFKKAGKKDKQGNSKS